MPCSGRKCGGSGYIGSRWNSFLRPGHARNPRPHFKFVRQIYSAIAAGGIGRRRDGGKEGRIDGGMVEGTDGEMGG